MSLPTPLDALALLDTKIRTSRDKLAQLRLQVFNEEKKLDKYLTEHAAMSSALQTSAYTTQSSDPVDSVDGTGSTPAIEQEEGSEYGAVRPPLIANDSFIFTESPASPPPTAILSPPPLKNRLYAGHTPMIKAAFSPIPSELATPLAYPPRAPVIPLRDYSENARSGLANEVHFPGGGEHEHYLEGPLTAQDEGFLPAVIDKLQKVKSEDDLPHVLARVKNPTGRRRRSSVTNSQNASPEQTRSSFIRPILPVPKRTFDFGDETDEERDEVSPTLNLSPKVTHSEQLEGIVLKPKRSMNFGVPLGQLH